MNVYLTLLKVLAMLILTTIHFSLWDLPMCIAFFMGMMFSLFDFVNESPFDSPILIKGECDSIYLLGFWSKFVRGNTQKD